MCGNALSTYSRNLKAALSFDERKGSAFPGPSATLRLCRRFISLSESGGAAAYYLSAKTERHSLSAHRRAQPECESDRMVRMYNRDYRTPQDTFDLGVELGKSLHGGEVILLYGGLGAGKTLLTKGILNALRFDTDEVTSPSFTLVNLYKTKSFDVYHIDLWRLDGPGDAAAAVGLHEILEHENAVTIIEWADRLAGDASFSNKTIQVKIKGDGDDPRRIDISY